MRSGFLGRKETEWTVAAFDLHVRKCRRPWRKLPRENLPPSATAAAKGRAIHLETLLSLHSPLLRIEFIIERLNVLPVGNGGLQLVPFLLVAEILSLGRSTCTGSIWRAGFRDLFPATFAIWTIVIAVVTGDYVAVHIEDPALFSFRA